MKKIVLIALFLLGFSVVSMAQDVPVAEVYGGFAHAWCDVDAYSGGELTDKGCGLNGWNASVTVNVSKWAGVVADFGGYYGKIEGLQPTLYNAWDKKLDIQKHSVMIGPRFTYRTEKLTPFAHVLIGWARPNVKEGPMSLLRENDVAFAFGGGLDINVSENMAVRAAQLDYFPVKTGNTRADNFRYSVGVVFKLGSR